MYNLLIVDDNLEILKANREAFAGGVFNIFTADTGIKAIAKINERVFDCIILDILLPDMDGFSICKAARTVTDTPILFLSCLDEIDDKIKGLMLGGDDYMTKPYSIHELTARVQALLRRKAFSDSAQKGPVNYRRRTISAKDKNVVLSPKEFELFLMLYQQPNKVYSKEEILNQVWLSSHPDENTVPVHISRLRRKLGFAETVIGVITTHYGEGYSLETEAILKGEDGERP